MKRNIKKEIVKKVHFNHGTGLYEISKYQIDELTDELEKLFTVPVVVGQSEQFICPCCGSDKTYKTEAYHCNRCAVTTEL